ncbi:MAG TPA: replication initiator protein A [Bryobacteraceae bacterium]|jgi:hypothetical protein
MNDERGTTEKDNFGENDGTVLQVSAETLPSTEFVKVEKNLASLGFFTPSSNRLRNTQEKSFTITTVADGQRLELKGTIIPSAKYGLPITADQDKWIALCKILSDILQREGQVTNPVSFTSADILRLLHKHRHSGKNYREIEEWLDVLFSTTIFSEGVVYLAKEKRRVKDRFRVFDRVVSFGKELADGKVADKNYVWLSDWQIQNINNNHLLPIDLEAYRELRNHIAKALVPLLQIWLYATRDKGVFEKRYSELCEILNIRQYQYRSLIVQTLGPSLDELKQFGYLADWQIADTSDKHGYKIILYHGEKFHRDRRARLTKQRTQADSSLPRLYDDRARPAAPREHGIRTPQSHTHARPEKVFDPDLIAEFVRRGITEKKAENLLANLKTGQEQNLIAQLEHAEYSVLHSRTPIDNPAGFIIYLIEMNTPVPDGFETSAKRIARETRERRDHAQRDAEDAREQLELAYEEYRDAEVDQYIRENADAFEAMKDAKWKEDQARFSFATESMARMEIRYQIRGQLPLLTFEEFLTRREQGGDFSLKLVAHSPVAESLLVIAPPEELIAAQDPSSVPADLPEAAPAGDSANAPEVEPETNLAMPEPMMIQLASEPPYLEPGEAPSETGLA